MHTIKITPNLLFEYQCTSGKFIRLPDRIEKIDSVARIESNGNFFAGIGMLYSTGVDDCCEIGLGSLWVRCHGNQFFYLFNPDLT